MTIDIPKGKWTQFFNDLSKRRFGWTAKIKVMAESLGDQVLSDDLPFNGVTVEERGPLTTIEISVGEAASHQSHSIVNPSKVAFYDNEENLGGIVEIVESNGTKTLLHLIEPMRVIMSYTEYDAMVAAV